MALNNRDRRRLKTCVKVVIGDGVVQMSSEDASMLSRGYFQPYQNEEFRVGEVGKMTDPPT